MTMEKFLTADCPVIRKLAKMAMTNSDYLLEKIDAYGYVFNIRNLGKIHLIVKTKDGWDCQLWKQEYPFNVWDPQENYLILLPEEIEKVIQEMKNWP